MSHDYLEITPSGSLKGSVALSGAKNAVLVIMASLILTSGRSCLKNVPTSDDVYHFITLLRSLGAEVFFDENNNYLEVDTTSLNSFSIDAFMMSKIRASILIMGPLLARFGRAEVALPGGDCIGSRPIDFHIKAFQKMGAVIHTQAHSISAIASSLRPIRCVLEYPSVGATENILMAASLTPGCTHIINAAIEPEVLDLITVLKKMGACITVQAPATIIIEGVSHLNPIEHEVMPDRLEAGSLLLAAAITKGSITLKDAQGDALDVFLQKLEDMGHQISIGESGVGISLQATETPQAVSFRTGPFPGFPTDLQPPMMVAQCLAEGTSIIQETVYEKRLIHVRELQKMGAHITTRGDNVAIIQGVRQLYGTQVVASDIRAACALVLAGLGATGPTILQGVHHLRRGYQYFEKKLAHLGARIDFIGQQPLPISSLSRIDHAGNQVS